MYYAQLIRFHTDSPFALGPDIQVRRIREILPKEELEVRAHELRLRAPNGQWRGNTRGLDWAFVVDKAEPTDLAKAEKEFARIGHDFVWALCCLKIVGGFPMGMGCLHSERICWPESLYAPWGMERPIVKATGSTAKAAKALFEQHVKPTACSLKEFDPLGLALHRYASAVSKPTPREAVVDLVIALEALVLPGSGAVGYRFRHRLAWLLAGDASARAAILKQAREAYDLRSMVVHGSDDAEARRKKIKKKKIKNETKILNETSSLCAAAIRAYLDGGYHKLKDREHAFERLTLGLPPS